MNISNRCRTCLELTNDPVKITLSIYEFLEKTLQINQVPRDHESIQLPKNICFKCYEEITKFKRFHQLCKDSEEFLKSKIETHVEELNKSAVCKVEFDPDSVEILDEDEEVDGACDFEPEENDKGITVLEAEQEQNETLENTQEEASNDSPIEEVQRDEENSHLVPIKTVAAEEEHCSEGNDEIQEENYTFLLENDEDNSLIEYQMAAMESESGEQVLMATQENHQLHDTDDQTTMQECEVLDYDSFEEDSGNIEISYGDSDFSEPSKPTKRSKTTRMVTTYTEYRREYPCKICGKVFTTRSTLRSHEYIHYDARPYVCDVCGKSFRQSNVLVTHMALHTGKKIECDLCGKKFARKSQMILHNRMHTDERPFICDFPQCNASFRQNQYLIAHKETHTGVRKHQCEACGKRFFNRPSLLGHVHRVHGSIFYQCDMCVRVFKKPLQIRTHLKTEHLVDISDVSHLKTRSSSNSKNIS